MQRIMVQVTWGALGLIAICLVGLITITVTHDGAVTETVVTALVAIASAAVPTIVGAIVHYMLTQTSASVSSSSPAPASNPPAASSAPTVPAPVDASGGAV